MAEASNPSSKPVQTNYRNMGGINQKASEYSLDKTQFLNLSNLDFDTPNALSKRPGSTQAISAGTSGPISSLFEYQRLDGSSAVIVGSDTAMFYIGGGGLTLLDTGWNNGQPTDMLTFVNKLWLANGQKFMWQATLGTSLTPAGLPIQTSSLDPAAQSGSTASAFSVFGYTMGAYTSLTQGARVYLYGAYSFVRSDGYQGPLNSITTAVKVSPFAIGLQPDGGTYWQGASGGNYGVDIPLLIGGITSPPSGYGITALALYFLIDTGVGLSMINSNVNTKTSLGGVPFPNYISLREGADPTNFKFFTLIPYSSPTLSIVGASFWPSGGVANGGGVALPASAFSLMTFGWFNTFAPKYIEVNQNSMFSSGFSQAPSQLWFSEIGAPEVIEPEYNIEVRTNDGDRIYGIKAFNNQLIVLKQNSFHKVIGDSPDNYELVELSLEYGCISDKTICEYREMLVWLDQKGILQYNGSSWDIISTPVEDLFRRMNLAVAKEKACAVHQLYRNQIWFGIPVGETTQNNFTVVYDYLVEAWTFFEGFNPASFALIQGGLSKPTVWRGDYSGLVHYHGESMYSDNGAGITCLMRPHWDKLSENETWVWRRFFLDIATASGVTGVMNGQLYSNYNASTVQATFAMYQDQFQSRAEFGVPAKSVTGDFSHFSASLPLLINGFTWARRFLRNV